MKTLNSLFSKKAFFHVLKLAIFAGLLYVLLKRWLDKPLSFSYLFKVFNNSETSFYFVSCILFILPNWLIEARIWQKLIKSVQPHGIWESLKAVLSGLTLGILTPFMTGDYIGRVANLSPKDRKAGIGSNLAGSYIFTLLSIHLGCLGLGYFLFFVLPSANSSYWFLFYALFISAFLGTVILFSPAPTWLAKFNFLKPFLESFLSFSKFDLIAIYAIALLRYCVFIFQFVLLFWAFDVSVPIIPLLGGILVIFLAKTIGSGINIFGDLAGRELVGLAYFNLFGADAGAVAWVIFLLWLLNIIIPAFAGFLFISRLKNIKLGGV